MQRISTTTKAVDLFGAGKHGFRDGNLALAQAPTDFNADWPNGVQEELLGLIENAGLVAAGGDLTQVRQAVEILIRRQAGATCAAGGTADALTGDFTPDVAALVNGMRLNVRAASANASATPTFKADGTAVKTIYRPGGLPLFPGDIWGAGHWLQLVYDQTLDGYILLNPANPLAPPVRQTVLSGPVDAAGLPNFGNSTAGTATITTVGTLVLTAANGMADRIGRITNGAWATGGVNGTHYLYGDIAANGAVTPVVNQLAPSYVEGSSYSTTNNQFTFSIQEMTGKVGNGAAANQAWRVCLGECVVAGGVVTSVTWYAVQGRFASDGTASLGVNVAAVSHNLGVQPRYVRAVLINVVADSQYSVGDEVPIETIRVAGASNDSSMSCGSDKKVAWSLKNTATGIYQRSTATLVSVTESNWRVKFYVSRGW